MFSKKRIILIGIISVMIACSPALYIPIEQDGVNSGVPYENLLEGRKLYVSKCGSCHNLYLPEKYTSKEWEKNLLEMKDQVKIADDELMMIKTYLDLKAKKL